MAGLGLAGTLLPGALRGASSEGFPDKLNPTYKLDGAKLTDYKLVTTYNNFYEWGLTKRTRRHRPTMVGKPTPWTLTIGGLCNKPVKYEAINDLVKAAGGIEQRNYRHRCVEAWSMVIPWDGFPLAKLITLCEPKPEAKFVQFTTFMDPDVCEAQKNTFTFSWPYTEGLTIAEANHPLAFLATGIYGKPLLNQNGAPIRLVVPWKYGFKGAKSLTKIDFVADQARDALEHVGANEYGFLRQRQPGSGSPTLESGQRARHRRRVLRRPAQDGQVQRVRKGSGRALHRAGPQEKLLSVRPGRGSERWRAGVWRNL